MMEKVILLTFQTSEFMNYDFVSRLLQRLDLNNGGDIRFNSIEAVNYTAENRNELLPLLNYKKILFELTTQNNEIKLIISNHHVIDFSELELICLEDKIDKYIEIIIELFGSSFFTLHVQDLKKYNKQDQTRKLLKSKYDESFVSKLFLEYIYRYLGINLGISPCMYYGKYFYKFISKEKLLNYPSAFKFKENDEIIVIELYKNESRKNKKVIKDFKEYFQFDELVKEVMSMVYENIHYIQYFLTGYEKYDEDLFDGNYLSDLEEIRENKKEYHIPLFDYELVFKRDEDALFDYTDNDLGAAEIFAYFVYRKERIDDIHYVSASIVVELSNIDESADIYATENGYALTKINNGHFIFEKEDNGVLTIINHYILEEDTIYYDIRLEIHEDKFEKSEIIKMINEYNKMIKSVKLLK